VVIKWRILILLHVAFTHGVVIYIGWTHCTESCVQSLHKHIESFHSDVFMDCIQTATPASVSLMPFLLSLHIPGLFYN
jgi:hypothetical protein